MAHDSCSRIRRDIRGQAMAEFAFAVPVLLLLLFGIFEFSRHYYTRLTIRHTVAEAARFASTGQIPEDEDGEPVDRNLYVIETLEARAAELGLIVEDGGIRMHVLGDDEPVPGAGGPDEVVQIEADLRFAFNASPIVHILASPFVDFTVVTTYKNEPRF